VAELWTLSSATVSLRRRLSDGPDDKYVHQMEVDPEPDGTLTVFAVPDSRLVADTLELTLDGVPAVPDVIDLPAGRFSLAAPDSNQKLRASYYFQWFTDAELQDFLGSASNLLGYTGVEDTTLPLGLHPPTLGFACYYAYMKKAAEAADSVSASAGGFSTDTNRQNPNWLAMARVAWDMATNEREAFEEPVGEQKPAMAFVSYRMHRYVPRS
jgi:hypothetical protein